MGMRVSGGVLSMVGSICIGVWCRMQFLQRMRMLKEMQRGIVLLKSEIVYARTPLAEACMSVSIRGEGTSQAFFRRIGERMQTGDGTAQQIWKETMEEVYGQRKFCKRDYEEICQLGNTLGYLDVELQVRMLDLCVARLEDSILCYEKEKRNQTRLYPLLGTFAGFVLCLVLI